MQNASESKIAITTSKSTRCQFCGIIIQSSTKGAIALNPNQLDLFANSLIQPTHASRPETLIMNHDALVQWKQRIFEYQRRVRESQAPQQTSLFDTTPAHCDPDAIAPFDLELRSLSFYRMPADSPGDACIYFITDYEAKLLLYVGETCRSNKRWKGVHDCKGYIESYLDLHYKYGMKTAVNISFWWDTPMETRARQQLKLSLILKWKSPFNKENWERWGQPLG